jgi:hypothetical protein
MGHPANNGVVVKAAEMIDWLTKFRAAHQPTTLQLDGQMPAKIRSRMESAQRALAADEIALLRALLERGGHEAFLPQLEAACVTGGCSCGCPTIDIAVPENSAVRTAAPRILVDVLGDVEGKLVGVLVFQAQGMLTGLEVYDLAGFDGKFGLPTIESIQPFESMSERDGKT